MIHPVPADDFMAPSSDRSATAAPQATEPEAAPEFGLLAKGEARRKLMEHCKRHPAGLAGPCQSSTAHRDTLW
jgi:hypothetical protein